MLQKDEQEEDVEHLNIVGDSEGFSQELDYGYSNIKVSMTKNLRRYKRIFVALLVKREMILLGTYLVRKD